MELHAYTRTISDVFSQKRKYVVPRFQRPYSWVKEQIRELVEDILNNIEIKDGLYINQEYFIGSMVLIGDEKDLSMQIVDGQQRLTTLTILLSALCQKFIDIESEPLANSIYTNYISGVDDNAQKYFKLENENPKPYFQTEIQHLHKKNKNIANTEEEKTLENSYNLCTALLSEANLAGRFAFKKTDKEAYKKALVSIRDQVVNNLKVIYITVKEEEEAYTIFETLNARGMNLSFVDLIKNKLFKSLKDLHPDDDAKTYWNNIKKELSKRDGPNVDMEQFIRHWWISKYSYASKENIYPAFKKESSKIGFSALDFVEDLLGGAKLYTKLFSPIAQDFTQQQDKEIFTSLVSIRNFNITQNRPLIMSLFDAQSKGNLKHADLNKILEKIEKFHFAFNSICSMRPSGIEGSYSKAARGLRTAKSKREVTAIIKELNENLLSWMPEKDLFIEGFLKLKYSSEITKDKKIIQYIFLKFERSNSTTDEFEPSNITIEHIASQSDDDISKRYEIGNLLPLGGKINSRIGSKKIDQKIKSYQSSNYSMVKDFLNDYKELNKWDDDSIDKRGKKLASDFYDAFLTW